MQVFAGMDPALPLGEVGAYARRAEQLGYDGMHVAEMIRDPYAASALALSATTTLRVRTAVALAFVRSPMATALSAWDLAHLSGGRFDLGLGTQIRQNIEERYGMPFERPVARMADHLGAVRACFDAFENGTDIDHVGEFHGLSRLQPDFRPEPLGDVRRPQLWLGAVGEQMVRLAGRAADGLITHPTNSHPIDLRGRLIPALVAGAEPIERSTPPLVVAPMVATGRDTVAVAEARAQLCHRLGFLYSTPAYWPTLEALGFDELGPALRASTREKAWDRLGSILDDEMLDRLVPSGTWDELPGVLDEWYGEIAVGLTLRPPVEPNDDGSFAGVIEAVRAGDAPTGNGAAW